MRRIGRAATASAALLAMGFAAMPAAAETCFHTCLKSRLVETDVDDPTIRGYMKDCRDRCEAETRAALAARGLDKVLACVPERLSDADFKKLRSASASVTAYANAFTWDVANVLPDKILRRIEITTQNLDLQDVTVSGGGTVPPGETGTIVMSGVFDGYPQMRVSTRITAVYACPMP